MNHYMIDKIEDQVHSLEKVVDRYCYSVENISLFIKRT